MKTKKLLFLTAVLLLFTFVSALAQRGTCTTTGTLSDQYYKINNGTQVHDYGSSTANATIPTVPIGAFINVGMRNNGKELDNGVAYVSIDVYKDDVFVTNYHNDATGNNLITTNGAWQPVIPASNFTAGAVIKVVMTVTPTTAFNACSVGNPWTYTYTFKTATGCLAATPTFFYNNNNGSNWVDPAAVVSNAITVPSIPAAGTVELGVYPNGGTFAFSDGLGFTRTSGTGKYQFVYTPGFTAGGETRDITAVFTDNCGGTTNYVYHLSSTSVCTPAVPIPYYNISGWVNKLTTDTTIDLEMAIGQKIILGINPNTGTVAWTGCNGFTGTAQEFTFDPGFTAAGQSCSITGAYKDICGVVTNYTYNLSVPTVCTPATPTFYYSADNGATWNDPTTPVANNIDVPTLISLGGTGKITPGMHLNGGSVTWTDGLGITSTSNQFDYFPNFTVAGETRILTAAYLDTCGNTTNYTYTLHAAATCSPSVPTFYYNTGDGNWHDSPGALLATSPLTIAPIQVAGTVIIGVHLNGGSITWTDDNATAPFTGTDGQFTYNPGFTAGGQTRTLTGAYLDSCGTTTNFVYSLSSALVCTANTPIFYYNNNNGSGWVDPAIVASNSITVPAVFASATFSPTLGIGVHLNGGSITWSDATGGTIDNPTNNQIVYTPEFTDGGQTRTLTGAYLDTCGNTTNYVFNISSTSTCISIAPNPNYSVDGAWTTKLTTDYSINIILPIGGSTVLEIKPGNGDSNGTFSWTDTLGLYTNEPTGQVTFNDPGETFDVTGVYTNKCGDVSTYVFHISPALGTNKFEKGGFRMYPNPADTNLNVVYNGDLKVSIVNASGQQILSPRSISKQGSIDVSNLSTGIYFLKAVANGESTVKKFIKK